jgi:hypothetical protein
LEPQDEPQPNHHRLALYAHKGPRKVRLQKKPHYAVRDLGADTGNQIGQPGTPEPVIMPMMTARNGNWVGAPPVAEMQSATAATTRISAGSKDLLSLNVISAHLFLARLHFLPDRD